MSDNIKVVSIKVRKIDANGKTLEQLRAEVKEANRIALEKAKGITHEE